MKTNGFESGSNGVTITTGNSGNATLGEYAFFSTNANVNASLTYDNTHVKFGSLAAKFASTSTSGDNDASVSINCTHNTADWFGRLYGWFDNTWNGNMFVNLAGEALTALKLNSSMQVVIQNFSGGVEATGSVSIPTGQWVRIEWHIVHSTTTTGSVEVRVYNDPDSLSISDTISASGFQTTNIPGGSQLVVLGHHDTVMPSHTTWLDSTVVLHSDWPGTTLYGSARATQFPTGNATEVGVWTDGATGLNGNDGTHANFTTITKNDVRSLTVGNFGFDTALDTNLTNLAVSAVDLTIEAAVTTGGTIRPVIIVGGVDGDLTNSYQSDVLAEQNFPTLNRPGGGSWTRTDLLDGTLTARFEGRQPNNITSRTYEGDYLSVSADYFWELDEPPPPETETALVGQYVTTMLGRGIC